MPFDPTTGVYTPATGAENAFPGKVIASATWNDINIDYAAALTLLGQVILSEPTIKTTAGPFTVTTETYIALNKGSASATSIVLPAVATRSGQSLKVVDWAGNAGDITFTPNGAETIEGLSTWKVTSTGGAGLGGSITLMPSTGLSGWVVLPS